MNELIKQLNPDTWSQVLSLFDELSELSPTAQSSHLSGLEIPDAAKSVLQKMLAEHRGSNILDETIDPLVEELLGKGSVDSYSNPDDIIGRTFGAWKVNATLASGGMGQVFHAHRADGHFEKQVALKIIKAGQFSELSQQRFMEEMRTLAQFEHPNIARLIDGGTSDDDIAFFVMELVDGQPICDYADQKSLSLKARVELLLQAIEAVEYAHQNLIIHGDIKPANLLVNESGQVKLVDFGIARSLEHEISPRILPQFTPSYSAPEQAKGEALSTASDVFGLCAVLYELCSGSSPRKKKSTTTYSDFTKQINTPISCAYNNYLNNRQVMLDHLGALKCNEMNHALMHELGSIIDKGLQLAITDRYKNTTDLRRDLLLYLQGSAVPVYANHWFYRFKKSISKHKIPVVISSLAVISIIGMIFLAINQARLAEQEAKKANWTSEFLLSIFEQADPVKNQQNPITVNELVGVASAELLSDESNDSPATRLNALTLIGDIQYKLGLPEAAANVHIKKIEILEQQKNDPKGLAQAYFDLGMDYQQMGQFDQALVQFKKTSEVMPIVSEVTHLGVVGLQSTAMIYLRMNKIDEAGIIINDLLSIKADILEVDMPHESMMNIYVAHARLLIAKEQFEDALDSIRKAKAHLNHTPENPIFSAELYATESGILGDLKRYEAAVESGEKGLKIFKQHYGLNHPETLIALANFASLLGQTGNHAKAIESYLEILEIIKHLPVPDYYTPVMSQNLAHQYRQADQCAQATEYFEQAAVLLSELKNRIPQAEVNTQSGLARCYVNLNEYGLAENHFDQALQIIKENYGVEHSLYIRTQVMQFPLMLKQNKLTELNTLVPKVYQQLVDLYGNEATTVANVSLLWAKLHLKQNDLESAHRMAQRAIDIYEKSTPVERYQKSIAEAKAFIKGS